MADGLSVWPVRRFGIPCRTACGIRLLVGTCSFRQSLKTFLFATYWCIQRIRGFTTMHYINRLFTYFYLLTYRVCTSSCCWVVPSPGKLRVVARRSKIPGWKVGFSHSRCVSATSKQFRIPNFPVAKYSWYGWYFTCYCISEKFWWFNT